jgi:ABC-type bacteriocin/lantibiotic exporter with double-glycine peptidase domain
MAVAGSAALFDHARAIAALRWRSRANLWLHAALWNRLLDLPAAAFRRIPAWQLSAQLRSALDGARGELETRLLVPRGLAELTMALGCLWIVLPAAVPAAALALAAAFVLQHFQGRRVEAAVDEIERLRPEASRGTYLAARFLPQLRTLGCAPWLLSRVKAELARMIVACRNTEAAREMAAGAASLAAVSTSVAIGAVAMSGSGPRPSVGATACALLLGLSASRAVAMIAGTTAPRRSNRMRIGAIAPVIETAAPQARPPVRRIDRIELDGVSFQYPGAPTRCLDAVTLSIARGAVIAVTGPSGSGKSTLVRLVIGLDRPTEGVVRVNGDDLADLDAASYRRRIGAVFQDQQIGPATVSTAILGMAPFSLERAWEAARLAQLDHAIERLPMGMQTIVSEGALSASYQRQLLIARALARSPDMLVLDEAMAPLDEPVQQRLIDGLRRLGSTVVVCAHRPSTLALADRIIRLRRGGIDRID